MSNETAVDGDDNTKTGSIETGEENSENQDAKPAGKKRRSERTGEENSEDQDAKPAGKKRRFSERLRK